MDWNSEVRGAFERLGVVPDADVVDELGQHAASDYQSALADGLGVERLANTVFPVHGPALPATRAGSARRD